MHTYRHVCMQNTPAHIHTGVCASIHVHNYIHLQVALTAEQNRLYLYSFVIVDRRSDLWAADSSTHRVSPPPPFSSLLSLSLSSQHDSAVACLLSALGVLDLRYPEDTSSVIVDLYKKWNKLRLVCGKYSNVAMMIVGVGVGGVRMSPYTYDLRFNCTSPPLLPCPSPTHTTSDYHGVVCYKCRPMVERDGKLYYSDNSLGPSTTQPTVWSLSQCVAAPVRSANLRHPSSESCFL